LVFWICTLALTSPASAAERFALVVGNNASERPDVADLRYADDDAHAFAALMREAGAEVVLLTSFDIESQDLHPRAVAQGKPTLANLRVALRGVNRRIKAARSRGEVAEFFLFFSGHGDVDEGEGYLVMGDGRLTRSMLLDEILEVSQAATNHVIIDACKSYYLAFGKRATREPYHRSFARPSVPASSANTGFILSTSSGRDSHEWDRYQSGVFSYQLRSALRGSADANLDGGISYAELGAFLHTANRSVENRRLRPEFALVPPGRRLHAELLRWRDTGELVVGAKLGHVYIESALGTRIAEVHSSGEKRAMHLPAERPLYVRAIDESSEREIAAHSGRVDSLQATDQPLRAKGARSRALERLFAASFGRGDVANFETRFELETAKPLPAKTPSSRLREVTGWTSVGLLSSGVLLSGYAFRRSRLAAKSSHRRRAQLNRAIRYSNRASMATYAAGAAMGIAWLWLGNSERMEEAPALEVVPSGLVLSFSGGF
jgi:hypothetical protein